MIRGRISCVLAEHQKYYRLFRVNSIVFRMQKVFRLVNEYFYPYGSCLLLLIHNNGFPSWLFPRFPRSEPQNELWNLVDSGFSFFYSNSIFWLCEMWVYTGMSLQRWKLSTPFLSFKTKYDEWHSHLVLVIVQSEFPAIFANIFQCKIVPAYRSYGGGGIGGIGDVGTYTALCMRTWVIRIHSVPSFAAWYPQADVVKF